MESRATPMAWHPGSGRHLLLMLNASLLSAEVAAIGKRTGCRGSGAAGPGAGRGAQPRVRKALLAWADTRNGQRSMPSHPMRWRSSNDSE